MGCFVYEILSGTLPFQGNDKISINSAILKSPVKYYKYWSPELKDLLSKIFINSPKHRITLAEILSHPWLTDYSGKWDEVFESVSDNSPLLNIKANDIKLKTTKNSTNDQFDPQKYTFLTPDEVKSVVWEPIPIVKTSEKTIEEENHEHIYKREFSFG